MSNKKALVVGINDYKHSGNHLDSCVNDANKFSDLLRDSYGFQNTVILQNKNATLAKILEELQVLFKNSKSGDDLVFYYSGHGSRQLHNNVLKDCLVTSDEELLFGDELIKLTQSLPPGILTIVLDSCFSGGMNKAFFIAKPGEEHTRVRVKTWYPPQKEFSESLAAEADSKVDYQPFGQPVIQSELSYQELVSSDSLKSLTPAKDDKYVNALLISACKADEPAQASTPQTQGLSAFTFCLLQSISSLGTNISSNTLLNATRQKLRDIRFTQTPLLIEPPSGHLGSLSFITLEPIK